MKPYILRVRKFAVFFLFKWKPKKKQKKCVTDDYVNVLLIIIISLIDRPTHMMFGCTQKTKNKKIN